MSSEWVVRLGRHEDLQEVLALERRTVTAPHWHSSEYSVILTGTDRCLFVAEGGAEVIGFGVGRVMAGEAELESVAVDAEWQRCGVGAALCVAVMAWCSNAGAEVIRLEVRAGSAGAERLYAAAGFRVIGQRPGYYAAPEDDAVIMEAALGCKYNES